MQFRQQSKTKSSVVQGRQVILDSDVAALYGVETKRVNEAIKNNPDKFPDGYILQLTPSEWEEFAVENFDHKIRKGPLCPQSLYRKGTLYAGDNPEIACCHTDDNRNYRNLCKGERTVSHDVGVART